MNKIRLILAVIPGFVNFTSACQVKPKIGVIAIDNEVKNSWSVLNPIMELCADTEVKAIILFIESGYDSSTIGYSVALSLLKDITALKKEYKKPIFAYSETNLRGASYVLALSADVIMTTPVTILGYMGLSWSTLNESEKLKKDGWNPSNVHAGKYKYYGDSQLPVNPEHLALMQETVDIRFKDLVELMVQARPVLNEHKAEWIEAQMFLGLEDGKQSYFVDKIGDKIDLIGIVLETANLPVKNLHEINYEIKKPVIDLMEKNKINDKKFNIGVITVPYLDLPGWDYSKLLVTLLANPDIKGIVLSVDCSGSNSSGLMSNLYEEILKLKKLYKKPVVAYVEGVAYSGGYWIAIAADHIVSAPLCRIGCIGYKAGRWDCTQKNKKEDKVFYPIVSGKFMNAYNENIAFGDDAKQMLQNQVNLHMKRFIEHVENARPQLKNNENEWVEAQIHPACIALKLGLIDQVGSAFDAVKFINKDVVFDNVNFVFAELPQAKKAKK